MKTGWEVVSDFEAAIAEYTGAPLVVCTNSGTAALLLALEWEMANHGTCNVFLPKRTYISVPHAVHRAGFSVQWDAERFEGIYRLRPTNVWDCALRFTAGMYRRGSQMCVSFAAAKTLGIEQGGAILHDDEGADLWLRRMRFDGRTPGLHPSQETDMLVGHHCPMLPSIAAQGLLRLAHLPRSNADQVRNDYPDLSRFDCWRP